MVNVDANQTHCRFIGMAHLKTGVPMAIYSDSAGSVLVYVFDSTSKPISQNQDQSSHGTPCWGSLIGNSRNTTAVTTILHDRCWSIPPFTNSTDLGQASGQEVRGLVGNSEYTDRYPRLLIPLSSPTQPLRPPGLLFILPLTPTMGTVSDNGRENNRTIPHPRNETVLSEL